VITAMRRVILGFFMLMVAVSASAQLHPVPLDKDVDAAKCAACHESLAQGKALHTSVTNGCMSCHEVRVLKDVTRVKLITATPLRLCLQCHANKAGSTGHDQIHAGANRNCLECHDPHLANNEHGLLKTASGESKKENLCLSCHDTGVTVPAGGSRHAALDLGCDTCHVTHKSGDKSNPEFANHLTKTAPALCLDCHDASDAQIVKAHQGQPFAKADCLGCHDPHQSTRPKLMQKVLHPPFGENMCEVCHEPAKNGKVVLTSKTVKEICAGCHSDKSERIEKAKFQHPGAQGDCTDCHNPHAGRTNGLAKSDSVTVCLDCHVDQAELQNKRVQHQPAFEQGCAVCHDPHGGDRPKLLRAEGNALCTECHSRGSIPTAVADSHQLTIFSGHVALPENYFTEKRVMRFDFETGHPVGRHPVVDVHDSADPSKIKAQVGCLSCHQPHAGAARAMLIKDLSPGLAFCRTCHQGLIGGES
jgi:predicted CXXCH cytochrome family protein